MTIQELYAAMGGNYDQAVRILKKDKLIDKYVRKLKASGVDKSLEQAGAAMDAAGLFESAHAMKGVCSNLGLDVLAGAADEITEEFRPGNSRKLSDDAVRQKLADISERFRKTIEAISLYEEQA